MNLEERTCPICRGKGTTPIIRNPADLTSIEYMPCPMKCDHGKIARSVNGLRADVGDTQPIA